MLRFDPLIGPYELPAKVEALLLLPEVQRLKDVRLLNIASPTFQALSEAARLSHSLAVVGLSQRMVPGLRQSFALEDIEEWQVSLLVHDLGTPPFGHLLEYRLDDRWGWQHDSMILDIVYGRYRPENIDDQIYYGNQLKLFSALRDLGVEPERLADHMTGVSVLGKLVSGSIDLDNIDNVFRMAALLGLGLYQGDLFALVDALGIQDGNPIVAPKGLQALEVWVRLRQLAYRHLLFDPATVSLQAMLTEAFDRAIDKGFLSPAEWRLTDHEVLKLLFDHRETRQMSKRIVTADSYQTIGILWFDDAQGCGRRLLKSTQRLALQESVSNAASVEVISYPFVDRGTLSKHICIKVASADHVSDSVFVSQESRSFVIGFFTPTRTPLSASQRTKALREASNCLGDFGLNRQRSIPSLFHEGGQLYAQGTLPF